MPAEIPPMRPVSASQPVPGTTPGMDCDTCHNRRRPGFPRVPPDSPGFPSNDPCCGMNLKDQQMQYDSKTTSYPTPAAAALDTWCTEHGVTPRQLALSLGYSKDTVKRIIRGQRKPSASLVSGLAEATAIDPDLLRGGPSVSFGPLADRLRDWGVENGVSGAELARRVGRSAGFKRILGGKVAYPSPALLDRLEEVTGLDLDDLRVAPGHVASLADAHAAVARRFGERHEIVRDLERFAKGLQRPLATIVALRESIEPELMGANAHRRFGFELRIDKRSGKRNSKRWSNFRRNLLRALEILGTAAPSHPSWHLSPAWLPLAELAKTAGKGEWAGISRLVRVADAAGIAPADMGDHVVDLLEEDLRRDPRRFGKTEEQQREVLRNAVRRWHALAQRFAEQGWPQVHISPLTHAGWRFATTSEQLAPGLLAALDTYVERATRPRAATPASRYRNADERSLDPLALSTAEGHRQALLTAAKTLVDVGHVNVDELTTIEAIVDPEAIIVVLEATENRHAQPDGPNRLERDSSSYIESLAARLASVARRLGTVDTGVVEELDRLAKAAKASERGSGVTAHNLARLRQFDETRIRRFLALHDDIIAEVERERRQRGGFDAALAGRMMRGVGLLLLRICPLRRANLGQLRWSVHFTPPGLRGSDGWLVIPAHETKHKRPIERRINLERWSVLERYMSSGQPLLRRADDMGNDYIFPSPVRSGGHLGLNHLSQVIADVIRERLDVDMHLHLVRHLYAWVILRRDPKAISIVSRILEHASIAVTERFYGALDAELAVRVSDALLDELGKGIGK